jgi:hypothetical protein
LVAAIFEDGLAKVEDGSEEDMCKYMYKQLQGNGQHKPQQGKEQQELWFRVDEQGTEAWPAGLKRREVCKKRRKQTECKQINRSTTAELAERVGGGRPYTYELRMKVS